MAVLALTSAKGAPGVSTAALAMTLLWPRPALLLEADPTGGSSVLAGYLRGTVDHSRGLRPVVASLSWDPASAEVLAAGAAPGRRFESSPLVRSIKGVISASQELIVTRRDRLGTPSSAGHHGATADLSSPSVQSRLSGREATSDA